MTTHSAAGATPTVGVPKRTPKKAAFASLLGSTVEYYDFFIYGTAASLVFPKLFFPEDNPAVATIASFATFGVAYIARPLGGIVMGHFGDRLGRKNVLLATVLIMGIASFAIALLPTYSAVGFLAPTLLVACRILQGFSAGAESAGASSLTIEHSPEGRRGFFTSFVMTGYACGMVLSTIVFIPVQSLAPEAMAAWGWRVPFALSAVVVVIAVWVRSHLDETPVFEADVVETHLTKKLPAKDVFKFQTPAFFKVVAMTIFSVMQTLFTVFGLTYATTTVGLPGTQILTVNAVAIGLSIVAMPAAGALSDRVGRKPVMLTAMIGGVASLFLYFLSLGTGNIWVIFGASVLFMSLMYSGYNGLWTTFFAEQFATPIRYTGMAMGNQLGLIVAGFGPTIGGMIMTQGHFGWLPVAGFGLLCTIISIIGCLASRETAHTQINDLGEPYWAGQRAATSSEASMA